MMNKILWGFLAADMLFMLSGVLLLAFPLIMRSAMELPPTIESVARNLLLERCPMIAAIANAILVFATFLTSIPAILMPTRRRWLKLHGYLVVVCAVVSLVIGLSLWLGTLRTRSTLSAVWALKTPTVQSLLQQKWKCCGYLSSTSPPFVTDSVCTSPLAAAQLPGCVEPFSSFANDYLDVIFTAAFGVVGIDVVLILCVAMLLKDRKEKERYRRIDEKMGPAGF